jgi:hypothetical protein
MEYGDRRGGLECIARKLVEENSVEMILEANRKDLEEAMEVKTGEEGDGATVAAASPRRF